MTTFHTMELFWAPEVAVAVLNVNRPQTKETRNLIQLKLARHAFLRKKIELLRFRLNKEGYMQNKIIQELLLCKIDSWLESSTRIRRHRNFEFSAIYLFITSINFFEVSVFLFNSFIQYSCILCFREKKTVLSKTSFYACQKLYWLWNTPTMMPPARCR